MFPFQRRHLLTTIGVLISASSIIMFSYLMKSEPAEIRAELTGLGDIQFSYSGKQISGISPLCGCYAEKRREEWRGITFPAKYLRIDREGSKPLTGYMLTSPVPANVNWIPSLFKLKGAVFKLALPEDEQFDPRLVLNQPFPQTYRIVNARSYDAADYFLLISSEGLNVALLGDTPLASWIPMDDSQVSVKYRRDGMHLNARDVAVVEEKYKNNALNNEEFSVPDGVPLGDFLGPNVIFWSEDESASMIATGEIVELSHSPLKGERIVYAIVTQPPFSVRLAADPLEKELADHYIRDLKDQASLPTERERRAARRMVVGQLDEGKITVSIMDPETQSEDFDEIYDRMAKRDVVWRKVDLDYSVKGESFQQSSEMIFRYPPIPPNRGFNIFGPISDIQFSKAMGSLALGSRNIDIKVPSMLAFKEISNLDLDKGVFEVPIQLDTASEKAAIHLTANSQAFLNDEPLNRKMDRYKLVNWLFPFITLLVGVLSLLVAVRAVFKK